MDIERNIKVPTGNIVVVRGDYGLLEFNSIGDYGKDANVKADFLGLNNRINGVLHKDVDLTKKWVITISTQYGCSMNCSFCDVPLVGNGRNATYYDMLYQIKTGLYLYPEIDRTDRLNIHFARMGEPTFNGNVLDVASCLKRNIYDFWKNSGTVHPVVSTMMPKNNKNLGKFLDIWTNDIKNNLYKGEAGLQFSINTTDEKLRILNFGGNSHTLKDISNICKTLPMPKGRKYTLNFALTDAPIDENLLIGLFPSDKFMCKITPMHMTNACKKNKLVTTDGYQHFYPYEAIENRLKSVGYDVIVFIPSIEEDESMITCGNAILSGKKFTKYMKVIQ